MGSASQKGSGFIVFLAWIGFFIGMSLVIDHFFHPLTYFTQSKDNERKADLASVQQKLEQYYTIFGKYPKSDNNYKIIGTDGKPVSWGFKWFPFMTLPVDPNSAKHFAYVATGDRQAYALYASLDLGTTDKDACNKGYKCKNAPDNACGEQAVCNYGISSANISP